MSLCLLAVTDTGRRYALSRASAGCSGVILPSNCLKHFLKIQVQIEESAELMLLYPIVITNLEYCLQALRGEKHLGERRYT